MARPHVKPALNVELLQLVLKTIEADQSHWNQNYYCQVAGRRERNAKGQLFYPITCHTAFCFAGWAVQLGSQETPVWADSYYLFADQHDDPGDVCGGLIGASARAKNLLGLSYDQSESLFYAGNNINDLKEIVNRVIEGSKE